MTLELTVIQARHLPNIGLQRPPSPAFNYLGKFHTTYIQENTKDPRWNYTFKLPTSHPYYCLLLTVFNSNKTDKDEILGQCSIRLQYLQTNKPTLTYIPLSNKISTIYLSHVQTGSPTTAYNKYSSWILLRTLYIEGELLINDTIKIDKDSDSARIPPCSSIKLTYVDKPSQYESKYLDVDTLENDITFRRLTFFDKIYSKQKTLTLCLSNLKVYQSTVGHVVIQVAARASNKDCLIRLTGPLNTEIINGKKPSNPIHCSNETTISVEYWESTQNMTLHPDCEGCIKLSELEWKDYLTAKTATTKLIYKYDVLKNKSYDIMLKVQYFMVDTKKYEYYVSTGLYMPAIKKPMSFNICKVSIKNCFLFYVLQYPELVMMFRDSEANISCTNSIDNRYYIWYCHLPMVCDSRNDFRLDVMCYDRNLHYGEKMLSDWDNGLIFTMQMEHNTYSSEINYTYHFLKYVKKIRLSDPTKTKNITKMLDNKTGVVKIECDRPVSRYYTHATYIIRNISVKYPSIVRLQIDGQSLTMSGNNYLMTTPMSFPAVSTSSTVLLEIRKQDTKEYTFSFYGYLSRFLPYSKNKMKQVSYKFSIFYETNNLKTSQGRLAQEQRLAPTSCQHYEIALLRCTIDKYNCREMSVYCETTDKKYRTKTYKKQTKQLHLADYRFFVSFQNEKQPQLLFVSLTADLEDGKQVYNSHIDLNKLYTNGRAINSNILLFVSGTKQPKGYITLNIRAIKCQLYRDITIQPHYIVEWSDMDAALRQTLSYIVRMTINNRHYTVAAKFDKGPVVNMNNFCRTYAREPARYHNDLNYLKKASYLQCNSPAKVETADAYWLYIELFSCPHDNMQEALKNVDSCTLVAQGAKNTRDLFFEAKRNYHYSVYLSYCSSSYDSIKFSSDTINQLKAVKFSMVYSVQEGYKEVLKKDYQNVPSSLFPKAVYEVTFVSVANLSPGSYAHLSINDYKVPYTAKNTARIVRMMAVQPKYHKIGIVCRKLIEGYKIQTKMSYFTLDIEKMDFKFGQHYESYLSDDYVIVHYTLKGYSNRYTDHPEGTLTVSANKVSLVDNNKRTQIDKYIDTHSPYSQILVGTDIVPLYKLPLDKMSKEPITLRDVQLNYYSKLVKQEQTRYYQRYYLTADKYITAVDKAEAVIQSTAIGITKYFMKITVSSMPYSPATISVGNTQIQYNGSKVTKVAEMQQVNRISIKHQSQEVTAIRLKDTNKFVNDDQMFIVDFEKFRGRVFKNSYARLKLNRLVRVQDGNISHDKLVTFLDGSILTDKLLILAKCNGQTQQTYIADSYLLFCIHYQTTTIELQLLLYNILNRQPQPNSSWMELLPVCQGTLFIPDLLSKQNSINFCVGLAPSAPQSETISYSFSRLLGRQDIYLLGNLSVHYSQWAYVHIQNISISNLSLDFKVVSLRLELVKQEITEKTVVKSMMSDVRQVSYHIYFDMSLKYLIRLTSINQSYYLIISLLSYTATNTITLCQKRYNVTDIVRPYFMEKYLIKITLKQEECRQLKKNAQIYLYIRRSYQEMQEKYKRVDNIVDIVDFRHKRDIDLMEVLACCQNNSQMITTLDEVKESIMFTATNKQYLCQLLLILLKVYTHHTVVNRIVQCLEILLARQPEVVDLLDKIDSLLRGVFKPPIAHPTEDSVKSIIQCRDWSALYNMIRWNRQTTEEPEWPMVIEQYMDLMNYVRSKKYMYVDVLFWLDQVNRHPTGRSRLGMKTLLSYGQHTDKKVFDFYIENNFDDCHDVVYRMYRDSKQDYLMFQLHLKRILEKKQWSVEECTLLLNYVEDLTYEDRNKFKETLYEQYVTAVVNYVKQILSADLDRPMILKKLLGILLHCFEKINPESKEKKMMVDFMKSKEKTMKIERKMMVDGFLRKVDAETKMKNSRLNRETKKNPEHKYLISRLDY